jgi:hypothetical protein
MALYLCIVFQDGRVLDVGSIEATDDTVALTRSMRVMDGRPDCSGFELWQDGKKAYTFTRPASAQS